MWDWLGDATDDELWLGNGARAKALSLMVKEEDRDGGRKRE